MRETFGGALMLRIVLVVIVLFVVFVAVSANYARAFRVKNRVIDILEQYEGYSEDAKAKINKYITSSGYSCKDNSSTNVSEYVVKYKEKAKDNEDWIIYNVRTCVDWHFPILNIGGTWTINGQTEVIKRPVNDDIDLVE